MALNATMYRFQITLSDLDRHYYDQLNLQVALHPSETVQRMLLRVIVFCLNAEADLQFTRGLSSDDEPDLWKKDLRGEVEHWIELGLPDAKRLRRAMGRADRVSVYAYGGQDLEHWWQRLRRESTPHKPMQIWALDAEPVAAWEQALQRTMQINCVIDDGDCYISWESASADADEGGQIALRPTLIDQHGVKP